MGWMSSDEGMWGDGPADASDAYVNAVVDEYQAEFGRKPSQAEVLLHLRGAMEYAELPETTPVDDCPDCDGHWGGHSVRCPKVSWAAAAERLERER